MNRIISVLAFTFLVTLSVHAETPERIVNSLYTSHRESHSEWDTVQKFRSDFTPGFYKVIQANKEMAMKLPGSGSNFLTVGNAGWGDFEVGRGYPSGEVYVVPIVLYCGLRSDIVRTDPKARASWPIKHAEVLLTDIGYGYQIYDLKFPKSKDTPAYSARKLLQNETGLIEKHLKDGKF